jgi:hypothetical protein
MGRDSREEEKGVARKNHTFAEVYESPERSLKGFLAVGKDNLT